MAISEIRLVEVLVDQLKSNNTRIFKEVPHCGQSVDLAYLDEDELTFIEVKVNNWRRAIEQCQKHFISADKIWIAIATSKVNTELEEISKRTGIGILHFKNDNFFVHLEAKKNSNNWMPQKEVVLNYLHNLEYNGSTTLDDFRYVC